ncbi:MAG: hypothetical protein C0615_10935, partial [Desulfuromonas sp.]
MRVGDITKGLEPFPPGDGDRFRRFQQAPRRLLVDLLLARIDDLADLDILRPKKLLGIFTRGSSLTQVGPIDFHALLLISKIL